MHAFSKGKTPNLIVSNTPIDGSFFNEEIYADVYERFGGYLVCECPAEIRDLLLYKLNGFEQISDFALKLTSISIAEETQESLAS